MSDKTKAEDLSDEDIDATGGAGSSSDKNHKKWIDVLSVSQGATQQSGDVGTEEMTIAYESINRKN
ncbi:MAG: type VI secretion system tube protein Hcp [Pseudomonadota bacterium]